METNRTEAWNATTAELRREVAANGAGASVARAELARRAEAEARMEANNRAARSVRA